MTQPYGAWDFDQFRLLVSLLKDNPWPSSDPRWKYVEAWAEERLKLARALTEASPQKDNS